MTEKERGAIIAENILTNIRSRQMTQIEFAKAIGIAPSTLTDYLKVRIIPSHGVIQKMADYFGIEKSDIDTTYRTTSKDLDVLIDEVDYYRDIKLDEATRLELKNLIQKFLMPQR